MFHHNECFTGGNSLFCHPLQQGFKSIDAVFNLDVIASCVTDQVNCFFGEVGSNNVLNFHNFVFKVKKEGCRSLRPLISLQGLTILIGPIATVDGEWGLIRKIDLKSNSSPRSPHFLPQNLSIDLLNTSLLNRSSKNYFDLKVF